MTTATKTRKRAGKFAPNQPAIKGLEDTDERIPELDTLCQKFFAAKDQQENGKADQDETGGKITEMLHEKNLELYIYQGKKFYIEPGAEKLKCVKVQQGQ